MYFRIEGTVRYFHLREAIEFNFDGPHGIVVVVRPPTEEEERKGHHGNVMCSARESQEPSQEIVEAFLCLSKNELPEGFHIPDEWKAEYLDERGKLRPHMLLKYDFLSQPFRDFVMQVHAELWDYMRRTTRVLRWRLSQEGPHDPFAGAGFFWSFDGSVWSMVPGSFRSNLSMTVIKSRATPQERADVLAIVQSGKNEPLGHELYREAWENRVVSPRSALIVGIAALEVGFKNYVTESVPETRWLLENLQSPPIHKMLHDYLVEMPAKNRIRGGVFPPPPSVLKTIQNGIEKRNKIAHTGSASVTREEVEEVLRAVLDTLWMLDYYSGLTWAFQNIRQEIRDQLKSQPQ